MDTPGSRLKTARERCGYASAKEAALAMDVPIATYTQHEAATKHLPARRADQYAAFFQITPEYLLFGRTDAMPDRIPVLDICGNPTERTVAMPPSASGLTRAILALDGDGLAHFGFIAIYNHPQNPRPPKVINGRLSVVSMAGDGSHLYVRRVYAGVTEGRYHLIGGAAPVFDHEVLWMTPVIALIPV